MARIFCCKYILARATHPWPQKGEVSLDLCSIVSKVMLGKVRLGYVWLGAVTLGLVKECYVRLGPRTAMN